jgi:hypothetical protein
MQVVLSLIVSHVQLHAFELRFRLATTSMTRRRPSRLVIPINRVIRRDHNPRPLMRKHLLIRVPILRPRRPNIHPTPRAIAPRILHIFHPRRLQIVQQDLAPADGSYRASAAQPAGAAAFRVDGVLAALVAPVPAVGAPGAEPARRPGADQGPQGGAAGHDDGQVALDAADAEAEAEVGVGGGVDEVLVEEVEADDADDCDAERRRKRLATERSIVRHVGD